ncbi:peptide chain release factor 2 [bacterium 210820-DFI.6.37]|nr:peptide chain release factor 2 [bacterium 210820-DFI.6.37]
MIELEQIKSDLPGLRGKLKEAGESLDLAGLKGTLKGLDEKTQAAGFWDDHERAQKVMKEKKSIENKIDEFEALATEIEDVEVLISLAEEAEDASMVKEIRDAYEEAAEKLEELRLATLLTGEYDKNNAIISLHGGSGGTDAKDWAEMLFRMYIRWAERKGYKVKILDYQEEKEGGINSATAMIEGENAYGYLKNEKGVHRLVRISPYDSSGRRHTSFASMDVIPEIDDDMSIEIDPDDLRIDTFRSSGAGGQHVNKTDSAIRITHIPTNIVVSCQNERSQHQNRDTAMKLLMSKLVELKEQEHKENLKELQGDYSQITWGSQIRSYVFHPYTMVKDHRTGAEVGNVAAVMDGDIDYFINEKLKQKER